MKKLAIIGSGEFQEPLILKAKALGYEVHVFSLRNNTFGERIADYFYDIDIFDKDKILDICKNVKINGIVSIASDVTTGTVTYIAENMGLVGNSKECLINATNKYKMREAFEKGGLLVPKYFLYKKGDGLEKIKKKLTYPVIVKPVDRAGSRGVNKVLDENDLDVAISNAMNESYSQNIIIEEYIEGEEYSCECISVNGNHTRLAFTKKFTTGTPNFIETGHIQPIYFEDTERIEKIIFKALDCLEIKNGASHAEFKITPNNEIKIIEIGARMAGDCIGSHLVELSTGIDYVKAVIDIALGNKVEINMKKSEKISGIKFICSNSDYELLKKIEKDNKDIICAKSKNIVKNDIKVTSSSDRGGWFIVSTDNEKIINDIFNL